MFSTMHVTSFISTHTSLNDCTSSVAEFCDSTMDEPTAKAFYYPHSFQIYLLIVVFCYISNKFSVSYRQYCCELFTYKYIFIYIYIFIQPTCISKNNLTMSPTIYQPVVSSCTDTSTMYHWWCKSVRIYVPHYSTFHSKQLHVHLWEQRGFHDEESSNEQGTNLTFNFSSRYVLPVWLQARCSAVL